MVVVAVAIASSSSDNGATTTRRRRRKRGGTHSAATLLALHLNAFTRMNVWRRGLESSCVPRRQCWHSLCSAAAWYCHISPVMSCHVMSCHVSWQHAVQ
jgi:hypothetical protein